jgi:hypothetical protein
MIWKTKKMTLKSLRERHLYQFKMSSPLIELLHLCTTIQLITHSEKRVKMVKRVVELVNAYPEELYGNPVVNRALFEVWLYIGDDM